MLTNIFLEKSSKLRFQRRKHLSQGDKLFPEYLPVNLSISHFIFHRLASPFGMLA